MNTVASKGCPPAGIVTDDDLISLLRSPLDLDWRAHGIGFMKTYLDPGQNDWRVNLYHSLLRNPGISIMHDHPWDLRSYIRAGRLTNTRISRAHKKSQGAFIMREGRINCANFVGIEGTPEIVTLVRQPSEIFERGDVYTQRAEEIHDTEAADGTITVLQRTTYKPSGEASVFWPVGEDYGDASRRLTREEVLKVAHVALLELENNIATRA